MSEKRYTLTYDDEDCACISEFLDNGKQLTDRAVVNLLNEQDAEIKKLKKEILWWKYKCGEDIHGDK